MEDILIIGAGILGSCISWHCSHYHWKVCVVEKSTDVACGATEANSAIIHTGYDPIEKSIKAKLNVAGSKMAKEFCEQLQVDYQQIGSYVLACGQVEEEIVQELMQKAKHRDIPCELVTGNQVRAREPYCSLHVTQGLFFPTTAIVTPWQLAEAEMEEAVLNGAKLMLEEEVCAIQDCDDYFEVTTNHRIIKAKRVINCAGVHSEKIAAMLHKPDFHIYPKRGEYFVFDHIQKPLIHSVLFPVPTKLGKGILAVPTIHGNLLIGPNNEEIEDCEDDATTTSLQTSKVQITRILQEFPSIPMIRQFAGIRASSDNGDFIIREDRECPNFYHVAGIDSPGLASSFAISQLVVEDWLVHSLPAKKKDHWTKRVPITTMAQLSKEERQEKIKQNPAFGRIICRCEQISEGEIVQAIHQPVPAVTVKAIKKRVRPGMGRCQGGFCQPQIVEILARELQIKPTDVIYDEVGSNILCCPIKEEQI